MEVLEYNSLVCGFISRAWHNVWPAANIVHEETLKDQWTLPRFLWMMPAHCYCRTSISLFSRRVIFPWENSAVSSKQP